MFKRSLAYVGCVAMAIGSFLPFKHLVVRDVSAFQAGFGFVVAILAVVAAGFVSKRRYTGASLCAVLVIVLLALQYAAMERAGGFYSLIAKIVFVEQTPPVPAHLDVHLDAGFYVIGFGALCVIAARLYRGGDAAREDARRSAYAVAKSNGHATIGERKFDRTDRTE